MTPLAQRLVSAEPRVLLRMLVLVVDLEVQRGRVVEDHVHVGVHQVGHREVDRLLDLRLVLLQEVHREVQVMKVEAPGARQEHLLAQPLLPAVQLRVRRQAAVGDHREERALEGSRRPLGARLAQQHLVDAQLPPELTEHVHPSVGPAVADAHVAALGALDERLGREHAQDALGQTAQLLAVHLVGPAEVVDHLRHRAAPRRVPGVLGQLVVAGLGAVGVTTLRRAQVHA